MLKREEIAKNITLEDLREKCKIAERVHKQLGYSMTTHSRHVGELAATLKELGIEPFDPSSVHKYMDKMLKLPNRNRRKLQYIATSLVAVGAALITFLSVHRTPEWLFGICLLMVFASLIGSIVEFATATEYTADNQWKRYYLANYHREVPEFALLQALEVKEKLPSVQFYVDALEHTESYVTRTADPFLLAELGDERFYLDVWDEPQFERKL